MPRSGARRHIKAVPGALPPRGGGGQKRFQREENSRLGDIARELSHLRDRRLSVGQTDYLRREIGTKSNAMLMDRLAKRLESRRPHQVLPGGGRHARQGFRRP